MISVPNGYVPLLAKEAQCPECLSYAKAKTPTGYCCWKCYLEARLAISAWKQDVPDELYEMAYAPVMAERNG